MKGSPKKEKYKKGESNILDEIPLTVSEESEAFRILNSDSSLDSEIQFCENKISRDEVKPLDTIFEFSLEDGEKMTIKISKIDKSASSQSQEIAKEINKNLLQVPPAPNYLNYPKPPPPEPQISWGLIALTFSSLILMILLIIKLKR